MNSCHPAISWPLRTVPVRGPVVRASCALRRSPRLQVNDRLRDVIKVPAATAQAELEAVAKRSQKVKPFLEGKTVKQVLVLPKKLVNFVVGGANWRRRFSPSAFSAGGCSSIPRPCCARAQFTAIKYCCPVNGPDWANRGRLRIFSAAAIQALWSSCVIPWASLQTFTAAPKTARQRSCAGVRGSLGFTYGRWTCLLPRM
jgi:hypothetical protein